MSLRAFLAAGLLLASTLPVLAADEATQEEFERIIATKCVACHDRERIEAAMKRGDNWEAIQEKMLRFGANLSERDKSVLGTFWGAPLK